MVTPYDLAMSFKKKNKMQLEEYLSNAKNKEQLCSIITCNGDLHDLLHYLTFDKCKVVCQKLGDNLVTILKTENFDWVFREIGDHEFQAIIEAMEGQWLKLFTDPSDFGEKALNVFKYNNRLLTKYKIFMQSFLKENLHNFLKPQVTWGKC